MKHIYIATSIIEGKGIRAGENIKKGDLICYIKGEIKFKINKSKKDALSNPDWVGIKKDHWVNPNKPYKFLNHSCSPNVGIKGQFGLIAIKNIKEGEEITIDYSIIEGDYRWEMLCSCKNDTCRKIIRSIHFLPEEYYKQYFPYISKYFKNLYSKKDKLVLEFKNANQV